MKDNLIAQRTKEIEKQMNAAGGGDGASKPTSRVDLMMSDDRAYGVQNLPTDNMNYVLSNKFQTEFVER